MAAKEEAPRPISQPCVCPGHTMGIVELHHSPITDEGTFFVSACVDKKPMLRDADTGDWVGTFEGHKGAVWSAKLNASATLVATGAADFSAKVWDAITGEQKLHLDHKHICKTVDFSADETRLLTAGHEKLVRIFDMEHGKPEPVQTMAHGKGIARHGLWTADGKRIITGGDDGLLRVFDVASGKVVKEVKLTGEVNRLHLSPEHNILTTVAGRTITLFNSETFDVRHSHTLSTPLQGAALHPDGTMLVAGGDDSWVRVIDVVSGEELACNRGHHGPVHCVAWHPNGKSYVSGSGDATIRIWPTIGVKGRGGGGDESKDAS